MIITCFLNHVLYRASGVSGELTRPIERVLVPNNNQVLGFFQERQTRKKGSSLLVYFIAHFAFRDTWCQTLFLFISYNFLHKHILRLPRFISHLLKPSYFFFNRLIGFILLRYSPPCFHHVTVDVRISLMHKTH